MIRIILFALTLIVTGAFLGVYSALASTATAPENTRMIFQLSNKEAETAIATALAEKGAGSKVAVTIMGRKDDVLFSYNKPVVAEIHGLTYEPASHHWNANILFRSGEEVVSAIPAGGRYDELITVPVLRREVRNSDIISAEDLEMKDFMARQTREDTITTPEALIGKSPTRYISAQRPIRTNEIAAPAVVRKNSLVQLHFSSASLHIATTGQAMEDGAIGDVINIRNINSKRVVRATVEAEGNVRVVAPGSLTAPSLTTQVTPAISTNPLTGGDYATN